MKQRGDVPLAERLCSALPSGEAGLQRLAGAKPTDSRDRAETLLTVYDLRTAPLPSLGAAVRFAGHPVVAGIASALEDSWLTELAAAADGAGPLLEATTPGQVRAAMRAVAARDRLPTAYRWLAKDASWDEVVAFLALEGGPDGGFDDLVAQCQIGLSGPAKLELARNYWDEMGNGSPERVHTTLHDQLVEAVRMPRVPRRDQPLEALERAALGGLLATNRWLQPELLGALGLLELQAGPRCRLVLQAFDRLGAPAAAYPFYAEHAEVDPRHGRDWVDNALMPVVAAQPDWGPRIVRGAWWRSTVNGRFFAAAAQQIAGIRAAA